MTPEALEFVAARFRVLSEASRLKLILALEEGEKNVTGLVETTGLTQANASRHLQSLTGAGILGRRKEGPKCHLLHRRRKHFSNCAIMSAAVSKGG
jgi:ArsR family transcriptional regulator